MPNIHLSRDRENIKQEKETREASCGIGSVCVKGVQLKNARGKWECNKKNLLKGIIMETVIIFETVFKRGVVSGCASSSAINLDGIIPTSLGLMMNDNMIQVFYVFRLITTIESCQVTLLIMGLMRDILDYKSIKAVPWLINKHLLSLS